MTIFNTMNMKEKIISFLEEILTDTDNPNIEMLKSKKDNLHLRDDLGLTSFDLATLTVMIEDEYDVDIFEGRMVYTIDEITMILSEE